MKYLVAVYIFVLFSPGYRLNAQTTNSTIQVQKASKKIERGVKKGDTDTLAQGYFELGDSYYQRGELNKSEVYYQKSKQAFEKTNDASGVARSSRALAIVQEELNKKKEALKNYNLAQETNISLGDQKNAVLNGNDIQRLQKPDTGTNLLIQKINFNIETGDTIELINSYNQLGRLNANFGNTAAAVESYRNAYNWSAASNPTQAVQFNQKITQTYLDQSQFDKAVAAKKEILNEPFVKNSSQLQASEMGQLADIYIQKKQADSALQILKETYAISVTNGHTFEAKKCIEKLDSIYRSRGNRDQSLALYKDFLSQLPGIIQKDSSLIDGQIIAETEQRIQQLEEEKKLKDDLIRRKNIFNYWLLGSMVLLAGFITAILFILKKLRVKNKKIALQSLRREMNPHFIFNSLNSINHFIASNNELEANRYLTRFSTLMRRVMENSKNDFVLFSRETELLQHYLELEKTRFPDKFSYQMNIDESLWAHEQLYIPGMLIQPHLENAIWHGLRHTESGGLLQLSFTKKGEQVEIIIEDNGIGIAESKKIKTDNQKKHKGRGIENTLERIRILNELYQQKIHCHVADKPMPDHGVRVTITVPVLKDYQHEN